MGLSDRGCRTCGGTGWIPGGPGGKKMRCPGDTDSASAGGVPQGWTSSYATAESPVDDRADKLEEQFRKLLKEDPDVLIDRTVAAAEKMITIMQNVANPDFSPAVARPGGPEDARNLISQEEAFLENKQEEVQKLQRELDASDPDDFFTGSKKMKVQDAQKMVEASKTRIRILKELSQKLDADPSGSFIQEEYKKAREESKQAEKTSTEALDAKWAKKEEYEQKQNAGEKAQTPAMIALKEEIGRLDKIHAEASSKRSQTALRQTVVSRFRDELLGDDF